MTKLFITGGTGLLGRELLKIFPRAIAPIHEEFDIVRDKMPLNGVDLIIHCAAWTDLKSAETHKKDCYKTNVVGTSNIARLKIPMIYISTEYVFDGDRGNYSEEDYPYPVNFYAFTKLLGEYECKCTEHIIIRTLFKSRPFEHPNAVEDMHTSGDYVDIIAPMIAWVVNNFNKCPEIINIGTGRKSIYDLAKQSRDVKPIKKYQVSVKLPKDTSLNLTKWRSLYHG